MPVESLVVIARTNMRFQPPLIRCAALAVLSCVARAAPSRAADQSPAVDLNPLVELLAEADDEAFQLDLLKGMRDGLRGRRKVEMPKAWPDAYRQLVASRSSEVRELARFLALKFGDPQALAALQKALLNKRAPPSQRADALDALVERQTPGLAGLLHGLLDDPAMRRAAIRALAAFSDEATPRLLLDRYASLEPEVRQDVITTLASRPSYALALLDGVDRQQIGRRDISAFTARQLQNLGSDEVTLRLRKIWGEVRASSADKQAQIEMHKKWLTPSFLKRGNPQLGRSLFKKTCQKCHRLYDEGGDIGPDLTGSNRSNLDYVLQNVLDPSAAIAKDYQMSTVVTSNGRIITGIVQSTPNGYRVQTENEVVLLPVVDVDEVAESKLSMMPEGQWEKLSREEIRDLIAYLRTTQQVPLPAEAGAAEPPPE